MFLSPSYKVPCWFLCDATQHWPNFPLYYFVFIKGLSWDCSNSVTSSDSASNPLAISTSSVVISSTEVLNPSKSSVSVGISFFQTPVNIDVLTSSHESWIFLMASRMVNPFQKVFRLLCSDPSEKSLALTKCISYIIRLENQSYSLIQRLQTDVVLVGLEAT